jgi:hypothetical protein
MSKIAFHLLFKILYCFSICNYLDIFLTIKNNNDSKEFCLLTLWEILEIHN